MLYDLYGQPPEPGSLLESVFMLISKRRQEQELLKTRVLVEATLAPHFENKSDMLTQTFKDYMDAMFPFFKKERGQKVEEEKVVLKEWSDKGPLKVEPLWNKDAQGTTKRFMSKLRKGAERVAQIEADRKSGRNRRIG